MFIAWLAAIPVMFAWMLVMARLEQWLLPDPDQGPDHTPAVPR